MIRVLNITHAPPETKMHPTLVATRRKDRAARGLRVTSTDITTARATSITSARTTSTRAVVMPASQAPAPTVPIIHLMRPVVSGPGAAGCRS